MLVYHNTAVDEDFYDDDVCAVDKRDMSVSTVTDR